MGLFSSSSSNTTNLFENSSSTGDAGADNGSTVLKGRDLSNVYVTDGGAFKVVGQALEGNIGVVKSSLSGVLDFLGAQENRVIKTLEKSNSESLNFATNAATRANNIVQQSSKTQTQDFIQLAVMVVGVVVLMGIIKE